LKAPVPCTRVDVPPCSLRPLSRWTSAQPHLGFQLVWRTESHWARRPASMRATRWHLP
jgi:hypothetical protein